MAQYIIQRCGANHFTCNLLPLAILLLFCIPSTLRSQSIDSLVHIRTDISGEYSDIIRQRSEHSSVTVFARSFDAVISASHGCDTLALAYSGWNQYASYNNHTSDIELSTNNGLRSLSLQWISSLGWLDYSAKVFFPISQKVIPFYYNAWIRFNPFGKIFSPMFSYERLPVLSASGLGLKDFSFSLNENCISSAWNISLQGQSSEFIEGSISFGKKISTTMNKIIWYSSPFDWNIQTHSAQLKIYPDENSTIWIAWKREQEGGEMRFNKDGLPFGDLAYGKYIFNNWQAGLSKTIFLLPMSCKYDFYRWVVYGVGHFESWPFTPLAASAFDDRFYYTLDGVVDVHQIQSSATVAMDGWNIKPSLGFLYILPDLSWRQWEPNYLEFCIMNAREEPFSIQQCCMLMLGCEVNFSVLNMNINVQMEQYIPVYTEEHQAQAGSSSEPGDPAVSSTLSSIDGGRRIRLEVILP
jgi:hypothetical protein